MKRVEIIANNSIQDDVVEALEAIGIADRYTIIPSVLGNGSTGGRFGTTIWPEYNFVMILYIENDKIEPLKRCCQKIKDYFPGEGIKMATSDIEVLV